MLSLYAKFWTDRWTDIKKDPVNQNTPGSFIEGHKKIRMFHSANFKHVKRYM